VLHYNLVGRSPQAACRVYSIPVRSAGTGSETVDLTATLSLESYTKQSIGSAASENPRCHLEQRISLRESVYQIVYSVSRAEVNV
jgi:hypothetical protein